MFAKHWLDHLKSLVSADSASAKPQQRRLRSNRFRPTLEALEARAVPATFTVNSLLDNTIFGDGQLTLREAIIDANNEVKNPGADTITFDPAVAGGTIKLSSFLNDATVLGPTAFLVSSDITIDGDFAGITIQPNSSSAFRLFAVNTSGALTLKHVALENGSAVGARLGGGGGAGLGGAIFNEGILALMNSTLSGNQARGGDGHFFGFEDGAGGFGGGGGVGKTGTIGGAFGRPGPGGAGGAGGFGGGGGGGGGGAPDSLFFKASKGGAGGAGGFGGGDGGAGADGTLVPGGGGGGAGMGGAIFNHQGTVNLINTRLENNSVTGGQGFKADSLNDGANGQGLGGAVFNLNGTVAISGGSVLSNNRAAIDGGAIYNLDQISGDTNPGDDAVLNITDSTLDRNVAVFSAGALRNQLGTVTITTSLLFANKAGHTGGAIVNSGNVGRMTIDRSTLFGNQATGAFVNQGSSGAVFNDTSAALTVKNSTVSFNSAARSGGGLRNLSTILVFNTTISGNTARANGAGFDQNGGTSTLINVTLSDNHADFDGNGVGAGAIGSGAGTLTLHNTIVAGNFSGNASKASDINGAVNAGGSFNNLIGIGGNGGLVNNVFGNKVGVSNPGLDPVLRDNGGPTFTHALLAGSPAIDAGSNEFVPSGVTTDQRGPLSQRIFDSDGNGTATVDMGAFELLPAAPSKPDLDAASDTGASSTDNITSLTTPTFTGTGVAGSTVTLFDGTTAVGNGVVAANGTWSITTITLTEGVHDVVARAQLASGALTAPSWALRVTIDLTMPRTTILLAPEQHDPTSNYRIQFVVKFPQKVVGFHANDVVPSGTAGAQKVKVKPLDAAGTTYVVTVSGMRQNGTVTIDVLAGAATDLAGNPIRAATGVKTVQFVHHKHKHR